MKKIFYSLAIGIIIYMMFMFYMMYAYKFYNENSGFIKPGEWSWYGDVGTKIECTNDTNISSKEKCVLVVFSLKDGLTLKEFPYKKSGR